MVISGRVLTGHAAQRVNRHRGTVLIWLTCMPGHPAATCGEGETAEVLFSDPVPVAAGERVSVVIEWLPSGARDDAGPVWMPCAAVLDRAHVSR
jgi:hypothetical protein